MRGTTLTRLLLVILAFSVLLCGTVFALMFRQTDLIQNQFEPAIVDCEVHEVLHDGTHTGGNQYTEQKNSIKVKNTGNIDAYIRLRFVSYWVDVNGDIVGKASEMPTISINDKDWLAGSGDTYYCKLPVAKDQFTPELLTAAMVLQGDTENGHFQVVEVFADAIQSLPKTAAEQSWKVTITGKEITSVN